VCDNEPRSLPLHWCIDHLLPPQSTGIVDKDINTTPLVDDALYHGLDLTVLAYIALDRKCLDTQCLDLSTVAIVEEVVD
jgi:hypothetical protein